MGRRMRAVAGLWLLAEIAVYVLLAGWIGVGWTVLATLGTSALGGAVLARQGTRALSELRDRVQGPGGPRHGDAGAGRPRRTRPGDAGLTALGGLLMVLPGFLGDLVGLLCLLPGARVLPRRVLGRVLFSRLPDRMRGPVHVRSTRAGRVEPGRAEPWPTGAHRAGHPVIEGEVVEDRTPA